MGYSKSPKAILRVKSHLDMLVASTKRVTFTSNDPAELAYRIQNGMFAAKYQVEHEKKGEPFITYAKLKSKYIIKIGNGVVVAEPRDIELSLAEAAGMERMVLPQVTETLAVIGAAIQHQASEMYFPDAGEEIVPQLYAWASSNKYYIIPSDDGITLTRNDPGELAWNPNEL